MANITFQLENAGSNIKVFIDGNNAGIIKEKAKSFYVTGGTHKFQLKAGLFYRSAIIDFSVDETKEINYNIIQTKFRNKFLSFPAIGIISLFVGKFVGNLIGLEKNADAFGWILVLLGSFTLFIVIIIWISIKGIRIENAAK